MALPVLQDLVPAAIAVGREGVGPVEGGESRLADAACLWGLWVLVGKSWLLAFPPAGSWEISRDALGCFFWGGEGERVGEGVVLANGGLAPDRAVSCEGQIEEGAAAKCVRGL